MKKLFLLLLIVIAFGTFYWINKPESTQVNKDSDNISDKKLTLAEIEKHGSKDDCWMAIDGKVYDVTPFISSGFHPGKLAILMGCGKDASALFHARPNGSGSHSERAASMLPKYYIGELTN